MKSLNARELLNGSVKTDNEIVKDTVTATIILDLKGELNQQKEDNKRLIIQNKQLENYLAKLKSTAQCFKEENDRLKKKVRELQIKVTHHSQQKVQSNCDSDSANGFSNSLASCSSSLNSSPPPSPARLPKLAVTVVPKVAEKIRLKRLMPYGEVHGSEITAIGITNVKLAEHLVEDIRQASDLSESLRNPCNSSLKKKEFKYELEKLRCQADNLKSQIGVLETTLMESKSNSENLSFVCAQLESNQTALQMALAFADKSQEIVECLLMLAETQLSLTLASYQATVLPSNDKSEINKMLITARHQRRTAETLANQLLKRVQTFETCHLCLSDENETSAALLSEDDLLMLDEAFTLEQEDALRDYCTRLKMEKEAVQSTVLPVSTTLADTLEQHFSTFDEISSSSSLHEQKLMLENAVLLQELSALKESRADLRAQFYLLQRENERFRLSSEAKDTEIKGYLLQIKDTSLPTTIQNNENKLGEINLSELRSTIEVLSQNAEMRSQKSDELINDLKRANGALLAGFERAKRKYQNKISRLYQQLAITSERYQLQIKDIKQQQRFNSLNSCDNENANTSRSVVGLETQL